MSPFALASLFVSLAFVAVALIAYAALRLYLSATRTDDSVREDMAALRASLTALAESRDKKVAELEESVSWLRARAGM